MVRTPRCVSKTVTAVTPTVTAAVRLTLRFEPGTQRLVELTVLNARWLLDRVGRLIVTVPETVEASAAELGPPLTAA